MSLFRRKKYPEGASDRENDPAMMRDVYAGPPEIMAESSDSGERTPFLVVYAGPEFFDRTAKPVGSDRADASLDGMTGEEAPDEKNKETEAPGGEEI